MGISGGDGDDEAAGMPVQLHYSEASSYGSQVGSSGSCSGIIVGVGVGVVEVVAALLGSLQLRLAG